MKKQLFIPIVLTSFLALTGCQMGMSQDDQAPLDDMGNIEDSRSTNDPFTQNVENKNRMNDQNRSNANREHDRFDVSDKAAKRIVDEVEQIGHAYVLTSKNNAYVAASLRDNDRSPGDQSEKYDIERRQNQDGNSMNDRSKDQGRKQASNMRPVDENAQNRNSRGDELSDDVKQKIAKIVKDIDRNIDNVYVTTSPDFYNLSTEFFDDVQNGQPVEGFFDQIGNMIERVFPENQR